MDNKEELQKFNNILEGLAKLHRTVSAPECKQIYLVSGNPQAGKKTLIHYLMGMSLEQDVNDEDGQEILKIVEEAEGHILIENILVVYEDEPKNTFYVWFNGFRKQDMSFEEEFQLAITFRYLSELFLSHESFVKLLLVFPLVG